MKDSEYVKEVLLEEAKVFGYATLIGLSITRAYWFLKKAQASKINLELMQETRKIAREIKANSSPLNN